LQKLVRAAIPVGKMMTRQLFGITFKIHSKMRPGAAFTNGWSIALISWLTGWSRHEGSSI
jgi:hypothetical protein